jgi:hypothetical protein
VVDFSVRLSEYSLYAHEHDSPEKSVPTPLLKEQEEKHFRTSLACLTMEPTIRSIIMYFHWEQEAHILQPLFDLPLYFVVNKANCGLPGYNGIYIINYRFLWVRTPSKPEPKL